MVSFVVLPNRLRDTSKPMPRLSSGSAHIPTLRNASSATTRADGSWETTMTMPLLRIRFTGSEWEAWLMWTSTTT
jgi:hypothetical protein